MPVALPKGVAWSRHRGWVGAHHPAVCHLRPESWVLPAMVAASVLLGAVSSDSNWGVRKLSADQVRELVARQSHSLGTFYDEYVDGFLGRNQL